MANRSYATRASTAMTRSKRGSNQAVSASNNITNVRNKFEEAKTVPDFANDYNTENVTGEKKKTAAVVRKKLSKMVSIDEDSSALLKR